MARLRTSLISNYAGQAWTVLMGLAFVPLYLRTLGAEAFGLVGFMLGLQSMSLLLDFGIGAYLNREVARRSQVPGARKTLRDLVRTFEWLVWPISLLPLIGIASFAGPISEYWFLPGILKEEEIQNAVAMIGVTVACLWPSSFYASILNGMERQPQLNALAAVFSTLRYAGVVPLLIRSDISIVGFIAWHAAVAAAQTITYAIVAWLALPAAAGPSRFRAGELASSHKFALGIFATTGLALVINQTDRFVVSKLLPLQDLGYYTVALTVAAGIARMMQPMFTALYPRMSSLVVANNTTTLTELYHLASQCTAALAASIAAVACAYGSEVLFLWTGDHALAEAAGVPFALLAIGTAINGVIAIPYAMLLARGTTRVALLANTVALVLGVPLCIAAVQAKGLTGAGFAWLLVNIGYLIFFVPAVHRKYLRGISPRWYLRDLSPAVLGASAVCVAAKWFQPQLGRDIAGLLWLTATSLAAMTLSGMLSSRVRIIALGAVRWMIAEIRPRPH